MIIQIRQSVSQAVWELQGALQSKGMGNISAHTYQIHAGLLQLPLPSVLRHSQTALDSSLTFRNGI